MSSIEATQPGRSKYNAEPSGSELNARFTTTNSISGRPTLLLRYTDGVSLRQLFAKSDCLALLD